VTIKAELADTIKPWIIKSAGIFKKSSRNVRMSHKFQIQVRLCDIEEYCLDVPVLASFGQKTPLGAEMTPLDGCRNFSQLHGCDHRHIP
jgi:hypothetical protein